MDTSFTEGFFSPMVDKLICWTRKASWISRGFRKIWRSTCTRMSQEVSKWLVNGLFHLLINGIFLRVISPTDPKITFDPNSLPTSGTSSQPWAMPFKQTSSCNFGTSETKAMPKAIPTRFRTFFHTRIRLGVGFFFGRIFFQRDTTCGIYIY